MARTTKDAIMVTTSGKNMYITIVLSRGYSTGSYFTDYTEGTTEELKAADIALITGTATGGP